MADDRAPVGMRPLVLDSWHRSAAAGVSLERVDTPITLMDGALRDYRQAHLLARVFPAIDDVLGQMARDCDAVMAVADEAGQLLWVSGAPAALRRAETIGFVEGSNWDERLAGTNAPGMALALGTSVAVARHEHFRHSVRQWSCAATPMYHPHTRELLGVLDLTGGDDVVRPATMAILRATARLAEAELAQDLSRAPLIPDAPSRRVQIEVLGRPEATLSIHDGAAQRGPRLSPRHSEILLLLASAPNGVSGDELMALLYEEDVSSSTLRAELNRLRSLLGEEVLLSRPYRLAAEVAGDWLTVEARLVAGDVAGATRAYRGPILPRSVAPGVVRLREQLHGGIRAAVLASGDAQPMAWWTRSAWGADDSSMWQAQQQVLPESSPLMPLVIGQLDRIDREFGLS